MSPVFYNTAFGTENRMPFRAYCYRGSSIRNRIMYQQSSTSTKMTKMRDHNTSRMMPMHSAQATYHEKNKHWDRKQYERMQGRNASVAGIKSYQLARTNIFISVRILPGGANLLLGKVRN
jgi:hypothetical protein